MDSLRNNVYYIKLQFKYFTKVQIFEKPYSQLKQKIQTIGI